MADLVRRTTRMNADFGVRDLARPSEHALDCDHVPKSKEIRRDPER
jgi:hypothetical protein